MPSRLFQLDISQRHANSINGSRTLLATAPLAPASENRITYYAGLQRHPNGKIYLSEVAHGFLHAINSPNEVGSSAGFTADAVDLNGLRGQYGLPQIIPPALQKPVVNDSTISIIISDTCIDNGILISLENTIAFDSVYWTLKLNDSLNLTSSEVQFDFNTDQAPGTYEITFFGRSGCENFSRSRTIKLIECNCTGRIVTLDSCVERGMKLYVESDYEYSNLRWEISDENGTATNSSSDILSLKPSSGQYSVEAILDFSCYSDTLSTIVNIDSCFSCPGVFIPDAFTPNGDGLNDVLVISTSCVFDAFSLKIFNRWGEQLFNSDKVQESWDGTFNGEEVTEGTYIYLLNYRTRFRKNNFLNGTVKVFR